MTACFLAVLLSPTDASPLVRAAEAARVEVIASIAPTVVCIFSPAGDNGGSGVLIDPGGEALTNFHVVAGLGPFVKCGLSDGELYWAVVKSVDPTGDVALIKLLGRDDFPAARLGDSSKLRVGEPALVLGNPFLLADDYQPTVTFGLISGLERYQYPSGTFLEYTDCIQTDAAINPGNSGGPLFNAAGELIGINGRASFEKRGRVYTGAGYAISINQAKAFLDHLRSGRIVDHGLAGFTVRTIADGRVVIDRVQAGTDADRLGLKPGNEVLRFGDRRITSANAFKNVLGIYPAGWRVPLTVLPDARPDEPEAKPWRSAIRLEPLHTETELIDQTSGNPFGPPQMPGVPTGDALEDVPESFREYHKSERGFTNAYWNAIELERTLREVQSWSVPAAWRLEGTLEVDADAPPQPAMLGRSAKGAALRAGVLAGTLQVEDNPGDVPVGTGGLLTAVEHLQAMLTDPEAYFTEFVYLGSEPLLDPYDPAFYSRAILPSEGDDGLAGRYSPASPRRVDTVYATRGETITRFHFDRETAALVAMETQLSNRSWPCQLVFGPPATLGSITLPRRWTVRHAGTTLGTLVWSDGEAASP